MKYVLIIVTLIALSVVGYTIFNKEEVVDQAAIPAPIVTDVESTKTSAETSTTPTPVVPKPVVTRPVPIIKTFTMTEVALHADTTSCYSVVNGSVYDLTTWILKHPGGERAIKSICGKDGSDGFNGKHGGKPQPESTLASFKIGILAQ